MIIPLKDGSFNKTIPFRDGITFTIDYPTYQQERELEEMLIASASIKEEGKENIAYLRYLRKYLEFTVKDWSGIKDQHGNEIKFDQNRAEELIYLLTRGGVLAMELYGLISPLLQFDDTDKKKLP